MMKWAFFFSLLLGCARGQELQYSLSFPNAVHHEAEVEASFRDAPSTLELRMSRSSPGRYARHDFARNIYNVRITDGDGRPLPFTRPDAAQWNVTGHKGTVVVRYTLFGHYPNGTYNAIDASRALLNAPATFLWARGLANRPATVTIVPPANSGWKVATQLQPASEFVFRAPSLDYLLDSPILAGNVRFHEWVHGKQRMRIALHQGSEAEASAMARVIEAAASELEGVFGEMPEFDFGTYTFLLHFTPQSSYDGMEHRNSTMVTSPRSIKDFRGGATIHEFIHSWNIERIRPASLEPFNYEDANTSQELWFGEGFTNYYDPLVSRRGGLISIDRLCQAIAGAINSVVLAPGREVLSAAEMSQLAAFADGAFRPSNPVAAGGFDNFRNVYISHYPHGMALALGVDFAIRTEFPGKSLDDWMRAMWTPVRQISNELCSGQTLYAGGTGTDAGLRDKPQSSLRVSSTTMSVGKRLWTMEPCWRAQGCCSAKLRVTRLGSIQQAFSFPTRVCS